MAMALGFQPGVLKEANAAEWRELVSSARCSRCEGLMVAEQCFDFWDDTGHLDFLARRCVQCGEIIDSVILQNRQRQLPVGRGEDFSRSAFSRSKEGS